MEKLGGEKLGRPVSSGRVVLASFVGTAIEWHDFFLFSVAPRASCN